MNIPKPKATSNGLGEIHRESALQLFTRVKRSANPPGDSFIPSFDSHIRNAFPRLEQTSPKSSWAGGDIIEIQGPGSSGKTHLLYFWAMTCVLPHRVSVTFGDKSATKDLFLGGRNKSVIVCDCDGRWNIRRFSTIVTSYLHDRLTSVLSDNKTPNQCRPSVSDILSRALSRIHVFRPTSTLALAATLMALPTYHRTQMPEEKIGMLMVDSLSSFYWGDRWLSEQIEDISKLPTEVVPIQVDGAPAARPLSPLPRCDVNPLRHVLTVILQLRRSLGMVTFLTNWGLTTLVSESPSSGVYFRQHLRAPYPSPFEPEPRTSKFPLVHHITMVAHKPNLQSKSTDGAPHLQDENRQPSELRLGAMVRTIGKRPGEEGKIVESKFELIISHDRVLVF